MIVEYIRYAIPQDQEIAFLAAYADARKELDGSAHCLGYELARCTEQATSFILRIEWDSLAGHLQGFRQEPTFPSFFTKVKPFFPCIEEMRHYEQTQIVSAKSGSEHNLAAVAG